MLRSPDLRSLSVTNQTIQHYLKQILHDEYCPVDHESIPDPVDQETARLLNRLYEQKRDIVHGYRRDLNLGERRLRSIIESTPVGICITNRQGLYEYVNPTYTRLYGYSEAELIGNSFLIVVPEKNKGRLSELHDAFLGQRYELRGEWEVQRRDGSRMAILADAAYIVDFDGEPKKVTFVIDITDRKHAEETLRSTVQQLHKEIEQRQRQEKLREQVERIIRHDLRNPLNGMISAAELLLDEDPTPLQQRMLSGIRDAGRRLSAMLNTSVDLVRMEEGTYRLNPQPEDLVGIARAAMLATRSLAGFRSVQLDLSVGGESQDLDTPGGARIGISGEGEYLEVALEHLLSNAVEAAPPDSTVQVSLEEDGARVRVLVHNQGAVPESVRDRFFERYTTAGKRDGTGLGTFIARQVVLAHGGSIGFTTDEHNGTEVTLELPRHPGSE